MLTREEYVEQAFFFNAVLERARAADPLQDLLSSVREEVLATTKLPMAIDYMLAELRHVGMMSPAMQRLSHYFAPFQTYVIAEAENDNSRFDFRVALQILAKEAQYRADGGTPQGLFVYQFETICRNRLRYDRGLGSVAQDPMYDDQWRDWILTVRRQIGLIDFADLLYVRSEHYANRKSRQAGETVAPERPILFGEKEGRIALANRLKNPLLLFAALQRQLGYPVVPLPATPDAAEQLLPRLRRTVDQLERRVKLLEEESREGAVDLNKLAEKLPKELE